MSKKKSGRPHGHYCKICGEYKANEKFSGRGHATHICKTCSRLSAAEKAEAQTITRLTNFPMGRLSSNDKAWLENRLHDHRPEVAELAREVYNIHFPYAERNARKKQLIINTLAFEIHTEVFDEYGDELPVNRRFTADRISRVLTMTDFDGDGVEQSMTLDGKKMSITAATAHAACTTALDIGADAILTVSQGGTTARMVSRFRTSTTVVALLLDPQVRRQMNLYWGVAPIMMPYAGSTDELVDFAVQAAADAGLVKQGDIVVVTAGVPVGVAGTTNMIRVRQVGGSLINGVGVGSKLATGRLCVCRTVEEAAEKFHPGDVLVTLYTNNDFLPYIREAAAVICEEGSTEGHAATVGLTLDKAVIVGAVAATKRLEDGVLVSVDCARGVVQTLPQ